MATQEYAASIQGVAVRVTRLDSVGNLQNEAGDSYTTAGFIRVSFTPEYEEGDEITEKSASGVVCVSYKSPDTLKRITMEFAICEPDHELTQLVSGGILLRKNLGTFASPNHKSVGWASPAVGDDPSGNGVALEVWTRAIVDGKPASILPYFKLVFPYTKLRLSGDRVVENGTMATTFEGYGLGNDLFDTGPDERWEWPTATERPYSMARVAWAPIGYKGLYTWHGDLSAAISNVELATNVATITTSAPHGYVVGDEVVISGLTAGNAPFNGTYTIASVPTTTTFTYALTNADIATNAAVAAALVSAGARAVTELNDGTTDSDFNVPGNVDYNSEADVDYAINSIDDPTS